MPDRNKQIIPFLTSAAAFGDPTIVINPDFIVLYLNKSAQKLFGVGNAKPKDLHFEDLIDLKEGDKERIVSEGNKSRTKKRTLRFNIFSGNGESLTPVEIESLKIKSDGDLLLYSKSI